MCGCIGAPRVLSAPGANTEVMTSSYTVSGLAEHGAGGEVAIAAPQREPLTYARLRTHMAQVVDSLNGWGIGRSDRVALLLPNGPELAAAFVAIAAGATVAPLNPAYRAHEIEFYLTDLQARALILSDTDDSAAIGVAEALGVPIIGLSVVAGAPAGIFHLTLRRPGAFDKHTLQAGAAEPDDVALVLHTSGTTSRPKLVPLTQRNLCASAWHIQETLALTPGDRCLNVMPLFHIHGLMAGVLASLGAGASVACPPAFNAFKFFAWLRDLQPTWYTAVPTMHQMLLERAAAHADVVQARPLRLIRSSSSPLPPRVMAELEAMFGAPAIESYGMTEASHQITSNRLPPGQRKPGSVGVAAGPDIGIVDPRGALLGPGETGEVVIRGTNVTRGYENPATANAEAFTNGWFRTGDQGVLDTDGYLRLTGRLKEIINRGGEKISPREVDDVLMEHPAVAQVVTFALPHDKLGEDVAAAVVLRPGVSAEVRELRRFAAERLAEFKVPRTVVIVDAIPRGATGKLQRIGLAQRLGLVEP